MSESLDEDFDHLAMKQAHKELKKGKEKLTDASRKEVVALWSLIQAKQEDFEYEDLYKFEDLGISPELAIMAGFLQGIALPLLETSEVKTESLGELGVCLFADAQLFAFRDTVDGLVHFPTPCSDRWEKLNCSRFNTMLNHFMTAAIQWSGCNSMPTKIVWDGIWAGEPPSTILDQWVRLACQQVKLIHCSDRLESIEFEIEMRRAMED